MLLPNIVHLDADAFFVSVEQARDPSLRGKMVAVGGKKRGIIASASYEARARGVYTPMPSVKALKICPELILISGGFSHYKEFSKRLFDLCEEVTPYVERNSIDEGYLDLAPCGLMTTAAIESRVRALQKRIWDVLAITVSFGIAGNKLVASIASKAHKPKGFTMVAVGGEEAFLAPLGIGKLPGVGNKTEPILVERGLRLIGDVTKCSERELKDHFGNNWQEMLTMARGQDSRPVSSEHEDAKSYSQQETFNQDVDNLDEIERISKRMLDDLMMKVRVDGKRVKTLTVKIRYPGMQDESAGKSLPEASDLEVKFYPLIRPLLKTAWKRRSPLRLVSVRLSGVQDPEAQLDLFNGADERQKKLVTTVDKLRALQGDGVIVRGSQLVKSAPSTAHKVGRVGPGERNRS